MDNTQRPKDVHVIYHLRAYQKNKYYRELMNLLAADKASDQDIERLLKMFRHAWIIEHYRSRPIRRRRKHKHARDNW